MPRVSAWRHAAARARSDRVRESRDQGRRVTHRIEAIAPFDDRLLCSRAQKLRGDLAEFDDDVFARDRRIGAAAPFPPRAEHGAVAKLDLDRIAVDVALAVELRVVDELNPGDQLEHFRIADLLFGELADENVV